MNRLWMLHNSVHFFLRYALILLISMSSVYGKNDEATFITHLKERFEKARHINSLNGIHDFDLDSIVRKWEVYLAELKTNDLLAYRITELKLYHILKARKSLVDERDVAGEITFWKVENVHKKLELRNALVSSQGFVQFPDDSTEKNIAVSDLTFDDSISFIVRSPKTIEKLGGSGGLELFRITNETPVYVNYKQDKEVVAKPGTFVVEDRNGFLYRVPVYTGDQIIDSLSTEFAGADSVPVQKASDTFEASLQKMASSFSQNLGRKFYHRFFPSYKEILAKEYPELLEPQGIEYEEHFLYFLSWLDANHIPPSSEAIRTFLDSLTHRLGEEKHTAKPEEKTGIARRAIDSLKDLFGSKKEEQHEVTNQDENRLSYHDERVVDEIQEVDMARKKYGLLFSIIRLQGEFFDNFTYNRLTNNFNVRVSDVVIDDREFLMIHDIMPSVLDAPRDIQQKAHHTSFAGRLQNTTTYVKADDRALKTDLAYSESHFSKKKINPQDFETRYASNGMLTHIDYKGKEFNPERFITSPERLEGLTGDEAVITIGNISLQFNLAEYFDYYHKLERTKQRIPQNIFIFDKDESTITVMRNVLWFTETEGRVYEAVAQKITTGSFQKISKIRALIEWIQKNLDYIDEFSEVNKLTLASLIDHGGDCEDSFTTLKTLANVTGVGDEIGAVFLAIMSLLSFVEIGVR